MAKLQERSRGVGAPLKDEVLARLAESANVAQFISFTPGPSPRPRFARLHNRPIDYLPRSLAAALEELLHKSVEHSVNVRSFKPGAAESRDFHYGIKSVPEATELIRALARKGLYTICNETVDIYDGGVSGVALGGWVEFAPEDTPRAVEKPGTAALPIALAQEILSTVYRFPFKLAYGPSTRVEFSVHPIRRGTANDHVIVWEESEEGVSEVDAQIDWPNRFSRHIGDKLFGLLIAEALGVSVPRTLALCRKVAPFEFGQTTGTQEWWIRTCPVEQVPGKFTTQRGWTDPFELMHGEDPKGTRIASVLAQEGVDSEFAGAYVEESTGRPLVEGVRGVGLEFMSGEKTPVRLPPSVRATVTEAANELSKYLGPVRFEWAIQDGRVWILQLHTGASPSLGRTIFPGEAREYSRFDVSQGIEELRSLVSRIQGSDTGVILLGRVGVTSHLGDILRRAKVPSRLEEPPRKA